MSDPSSADKQPDVDSAGIEPPLGEREEMLRGILEFAPDAIVVVGGDGRIIRVNGQAEKYFGYERRELLNQPIEVLIPDQFKKGHISDREAYIGSPHIRSMGSGANFRGRRKDGSEFPVDVMLSPMGEGKDRVTIAIVRDITEQRKLEEAIMYTSEKERQRIGLEIHDDLCQSLVAVTLLSHALHESLAGKNIEEQKDAKDILELLKDANTHARDIARGLSAMNLMDGGFHAAVEDLATRVSRMSKIDCHFESNIPVEFSTNAIATHVYRIIQQAVSNAVTHAKASRIIVRAVADNGVTISVEDDGVGIPDYPAANKGIGLKIMEHRARSIGATFRVRRRREGGTEVVCSLPKRA